MRFAALVVLLVGVTHPGALAAQAADAEIVAVVRALFDAMRAKDTAAVRALMHPTARLVATGPTQQGTRSAREVSLEQFIGTVASAPGRLDEKFWDPEVRLDADLATVWTPYAFYYDGNFSHCGVDAFQLARDESGWRIVQIADTRRTTGCPTPPPHAQ
jgi:ketosteroid isomerase-like protein